MREVFAFLLLVAASPLLAQEDCDNILTIPELAAQIQEVQVDTIILQPDGSFEVQLSNGTTFTQVQGCMDPAYTEYNAAANTDDGSCATLPSTCAEVEMDGYTYSVVEIGDQCWFAENLRTTVYTDGTAIPEVTGNGAWAGLSSGARCNYDNNAGNVATYGRLYNWYAVDDSRGLCPSGWHVPTHGEWTELEDYITSQGFSGTEGTALKSPPGWCESHCAGNGTDDFGFSALPGGYRLSINGNFDFAGTTGTWWSSSPSFGDFSWYRYMVINNPFIVQLSLNRPFGFSVRCLRDAEFIEFQGCTDPAYDEYDPSANINDGSCATISGCTDPAYTEYDASANTDDGSCATLVVEGCTDPADVNYNAAANTDDGSCATLASSCSEVEMDGYTYSVVEIGDQCWFAENLRSTLYADGTPILEVTDNQAWTELSSGRRCDYNNDGSNVPTYGRLYNWYAVDDSRGLCPSGWHVPTDGEWTELKDYISSEGFSGMEGTILKSTSGWYDDGNGADYFGFSALPGGSRSSYDGFFSNAGNFGYWWSSSPYGGFAWFRILHSLSPDLSRSLDYPRFGFSVRCLRDAD